MDRLGQLRAEEVGTMRLALFIGEALPLELVLRIREAHPALRVFNLYGPTEATVACSWHEVTESAEELRAGIPFGAGASPNVLHLLGEDGREADAGELYIAGPQVAAGYWRDEEETARAFVSVRGDRAYRTGDRAVRTPAGFVFTGRGDRQVKVGGTRIELGDVEAALLSLPGVTGVAALVAAGRLVGLVESSRAPVELLRELAERVPAALVPHELRAVPSLPVTANGKIDRAAVARLFGAG
jgi:mycobactin phenyloxazoline synthetase